MVRYAEARDQYMRLVQAESSEKGKDNENIFVFTPMND